MFNNFLLVEETIVEIVDVASSLICHVVSLYVNCLKMVWPQVIRLKYRTFFITRVDNNEKDRVKPKTPLKITK